MTNNNQEKKTNRPKIVKTEEHNLFVLWVFTPKDKRQPPTQAAFAAKHGISESTLTRWKNDPDFAASIFNLSPSLVAFNWATVLQSVLNEAITGNMESVQYLTDLLGIKGIIKKTLDPDDPATKDNASLGEFNDLLNRMYSDK